MLHIGLVFGVNQLKIFQDVFNYKIVLVKLCNILLLNKLNSSQFLTTELTLKYTVNKIFADYTII